MKQILISFVAVVLGITAMSSYAEKAREASMRIPTLALDASKAGNDNKPNRTVAEDQSIRIGRTEGKKNPNYWLRGEEPSEVQPNRPGCGRLKDPCNHLVR